MKIFTEDELKERGRLISELTFEISEYIPDDIDEDDFEDVDLWVEFFDSSGCRYDDDELLYYIQNESPSGFYNVCEGVFSYTGKLSLSELTDILKNIGFK